MINENCETRDTRQLGRVVGRLIALVAYFTAELVHLRSGWERAADDGHARRVRRSRSTSRTVARGEGPAGSEGMGGVSMTREFTERARRLRKAVEPLAAEVYFAPEAHAGYAALGFAGSPVAQEGWPPVAQVLLHLPWRMPRSGTRRSGGGRVRLLQPQGRRPRGRRRMEDRLPGGASREAILQAREAGATAARTVSMNASRAALACAGDGRTRAELLRAEVNGLPRGPRPRVRGRRRA